MSQLALRKGQRVKIRKSNFLILQRLPGLTWQLQDIDTGEYHIFKELDLLDQFANNELSFTPSIETNCGVTVKLAETLTRDLSTYPPELVALVEVRIEYLKEIDRRQPISITQKSIEPLVRSVAERIGENNPPSWGTVCRDYRKWLASGRDIRAIIPRYRDRGNRRKRFPPEVKIVSDQVINELYMTLERKRTPEVHLEVVRRLSDINRFRSETDRLPIPGKKTIQREINRKSPYEIMIARYGKKRADMAFRVSSKGPETTRALQRVLMDHTPADLIVVDEATNLPLGRPTITTAMDEFTRCPTGFYAGFEPPSYLAVMRCLKHAILPKTYVSKEYPTIKNQWDCYGVPEMIVVDNPPEFHSSHFERACLQIGVDIQYAKVRVPWYKAKIERFQGTMNRDAMHGTPGTTFSNIFERDEYDPSKHAIVPLSAFCEILHKWIIDIYLQSPHRGLSDTPATRWKRETCDLPPPLPPNAETLNTVLGMTDQRTIFHYGIELHALKYNSNELGELRRRYGTNFKVDLTFDPGDLGHINVLDPDKGNYIRIPAVDHPYTSGLSLWQHKVIRRYTQQRLKDNTDMQALATSKAELRAIVENLLSSKRTRGRQRPSRFLGDEILTNRSKLRSNPPSKGIQSNDRSETPGKNQPPCPLPIFINDSKTKQSVVFEDDDSLPEFEAALDLPNPMSVGKVSGSITNKEKL